jgi:hypothetical protein
MRVQFDEPEQLVADALAACRAGYLRTERHTAARTEPARQPAADLVARRARPFRREPLVRVGCMAWLNGMLPAPQVNTPRAEESVFGNLGKNRLNTLTRLAFQ